MFDEDEVSEVLFDAFVFIKSTNLKITSDNDSLILVEFSLWVS
jgi:hypothetical protein